MSPCLPFACQVVTSEESHTCKISPSARFPRVAFGAGKALGAMRKNMAKDLGHAGWVSALLPVFGSWSTLKRSPTASSLPTDTPARSTQSCERLSPQKFGFFWAYLCKTTEEPTPRARTWDNLPLPLPGLMDFLDKPQSKVELAQIKTPLFSAPLWLKKQSVGSSLLPEGQHVHMHFSIYIHHHRSGNKADNRAAFMVHYTHFS